MNTEQTEKKSWKEKLTSSLSKTRKFLIKDFEAFIYGKRAIDQKIYDELETHLLLSDVGIETSQKIIQEIIETVQRKSLHDTQAFMSVMKEILIHLLKPCEKNLELNQKPFVLLMVGVNGAGKTTSIAKIAHFYQQQDKKILLAAGDTFRAAAVEQLQIWGMRNQVPVIAQHSGADSAAVIYDAMEAATARQTDLLIADTAGRLHTQEHLMNELKKIKRVIQKINLDAPHEIMLVIDASMGQNALTQAKQFHEALGLTGITLTKLDGTAKGGIVFAIADHLKLPIRFIGVGEDIHDLQPFHAEEFVEALLGEKINAKQN